MYCISRKIYLLLSQKPDKATYYKLYTTFPDKFDLLKFYKMKGSSLREYIVTANSRGYYYSREFSAVIYAHTIRDAWRSFKRLYQRHDWILVSIKSDTGFYTKVK